MTHRKKVLFVVPCKRYFRSFMQWDLNLLERRFDVRVVNVCLDSHDVKATLATPSRLIAGVAWADVVFCWFASLPAFVATALSQLYAKKTIVVVGGGDLTVLPEIGYGADPISRFYSTYVLNKATKLLPYSKDAERRVLERVNGTSKTELIYLGIDINVFKPSDTKRENRVLTVGNINRSNLHRKGLETFVKSAAYLGDTEFFLIGQVYDDSVEYLRSIASSNVRFTGSLSESELIRCYQQAKVYVQVSAHEAFGVAIAEAMACGCVPVVTDKGAIPEVVGETGVYVPYGDPEATAQGIKRALESNDGIVGRKRVEEMFTLERRRKELLNAINGFFADNAC
jgi:glycosyltransferase involved in cell wall biosynthesis